MNKDLLILNALHITIDGLYDCVPILLSFMILSFGAAEKDAGLVLSLANLVNTLLGLSALYFSRRFGLFRTLIVVTLWYSFGFLANAFAPNIYIAGLSFILGNAGFGVFHTIAFSYLTLTAAKGSLGKTLGDFTAIGDIGRIPLASLAGFLAAFTVLGLPGWRVVCLLYGAAALCFAASLLLFSRRNDPPATPVQAKQEKHLPSFSLLRERRHALPITAAMFDGIGSNQVFAFLPFLLFAKGIDPKILGAFAFAFTFGCFLGKLALGRLVDRCGTRLVFLVSEAIMAVLLVALILGSQLPVVVGAAFLLGIVTKGTVPAMQALLTEAEPDRNKHTEIFAVSSFLRGVAGVASPVFFGFIASAFGIEWSYTIMAAAAVCAVIPVLFIAKPPRPPIAV